MLKQFLDSMDEEKEYDFIANNYTSMTKDELKRILLEYIYAVHQEGKTTEESVREQVRGEIEAEEIFG